MTVSLVGTQGIRCMVGTACRICSGKGALQGLRLRRSRLGWQVTGSAAADGCAACVVLACSGGIKET